jgi:hypothetical protein
MLRANAVLPIDGPRREHDQVSRLQTGGHAVHVVEAGTHAGDFSAPFSCSSLTRSIS